MTKRENTGFEEQLASFTAASIITVLRLIHNTFRAVFQVLSALA